MYPIFYAIPIAFRRAENFCYSSRTGGSPSLNPTASMVRTDGARKEQ